MSTHSEFQEKMDVLDIIISILRDHEENLSKIADRFDAICGSVPAFEENISMLEQSLERLDGLRVKSLVGAEGLKGPLVRVNCKDWPTFRSMSQGALLVTFEVLGELIFMSSVSDLFVFTHTEKVSEVMVLMGVVQCGTLEVVSLEDGGSVHERVLEPKVVRRWLSSEFGVPEHKIIEGRVLR